MPVTTTDYSYTSSGNDSQKVRLIKDYALFLFKTPPDNWPTSVNWNPDASQKPVGYNSDDGISLTPNSGKSDDITGHNGDTVASVASGGNWEVKLTGLECTREIAEAYFGVSADENGDLHVDSAAAPQTWAMVIAGVDQYGKPVILAAKQAKVTDREDLSMVYNKAISFGCTFSLSKPAGAHMYDLYGLLTNAA